MSPAASRVTTLAVLGCLLVSPTRPAVAQLFSRLGEQGDPPLTTTAAAEQSPIPTAEALSEPGALQAYIDRAILEIGGPIQLPRGVIRYDEPLVFQRRNGAVLRGSGAVCRAEAADAPRTGWLDPRVRRGTLLYYTGPEDQPAIDVRDSVHLVFSDFSVQAAGVAVRFEVSRGWGNNNHALERVWFLKCGCGVECGREGTPFNCADISFRGCVFNRCSTGLRTLADQNVNYWFTDGCYWYTCDRPIDLVRGGNVSVRDAGTNGPMTAFLTIRQGGVNTSVSKIDFLRIDRSGGGTGDRFRVVDASAARSMVRVIVDAVQITNIPGDDWAGYRLFALGPDAASGQIEVRTVVGPSGASLEPGPVESPPSE